MIVILGMVGAGKTVQAHLLAEKHGWFWLSSGELLRGSEDPEINSYLARGKLVPDHLINNLIAQTIDNNPANKKIVFDGFPRKVSQAEWLDRYLHKSNRSVTLALHLVLSPEETNRRLQLRSRKDDTDKAIASRNKEYADFVAPLVKFYKGKGKLDNIDASGTVEEVSDMIEVKLKERGLL